MRKIISYISAALSILAMISCEETDERLSFDEICNTAFTDPANGKGCLGDFLLSIENREGTLLQSNELGFFVEFQVEGTYDCFILGKICDSKDYATLTGSTRLISADIHEYHGVYVPPIGGQKVISLFNLKTSGVGK